MTDSYIDRRTYLAGVAAAGAVGLAGCAGSDGSATGTLATKVTDQPGDIADFDSCVITIVGMWIGTEEAADDIEEDGGDSEDSTDDGADEAPEDGESADTEDGESADTEDGESADTEDGESTETEDGESADTEDGEPGREYYEYDEPQEADLVQLQGESTQLVDERELDVGEYEYLQLDTDGVEATLENGESATVEVPGNAPLTFNEAFEIRAETVTSFTADFTPVKRGRSGSYLLQPVPDGITVEYVSTAGSGDDADEPTDGNESEDAN